MKDASVGVLLVFDRDDRQKENKYDRDGLVSSQWRDGMHTV